MNFRYDINGLRAIAVLAVVIFHFNPKWLPGGFAGVDVFFVISGFLMTSIIFNGVEKNTFNLFKFYNARANRIIPVLAVLCITLVLFGLFYILPPDLENLGRQIQKSSAFTSNLLFAKGGGYFDVDEKSKWLLHTWSLSVEWQFYIFFPIIIVVLKNYLTINRLKHVVVSLFLVSFIYCIYATNKDNKTAYFLLTSRAWEMLLGGLAFLFPWSIRKKQLQITTQCLGLALIILSYLFISETTPWPGYMALIPVLGSYLIIVSNYQNSAILNNPVMSRIGKCSYSIYVWHWPVVVLGVYFTLTDWWIYGIPLSIVLGFLSYQVIEQRKLKTFNSWKELYKVKPLYIFLFVFGLGTTIKETAGLSFIYPIKVKDILKESKNTNPHMCDSGYRSRELNQCKIGNIENIKAIVIGDSHADAITTAVATSFNLKNEGIITIATSGCPFIFDAKIKVDGFCDSLNKQRKQWLFANKSKYQNVPLIIANRWVSYTIEEHDTQRDDAKNTLSSYFSETHTKIVGLTSSENLSNTICTLSNDYQVYLMQPVPEMNIHIPKAMAKIVYLNNPPAITPVSYQDYRTRFSDVRSNIDRVAQHCNARTLEPAEYLCQSSQCIFEYKGRSIYRDDNHLSEYGNKLLVPMFKTALQP